MLDYHSNCRAPLSAFPVNEGGRSFYANIAINEEQKLEGFQEKKQATGGDRQRPGATIPPAIFVSIFISIFGLYKAFLCLG
ncbi:MAG TPA: hypothetical protein DC001_02670 [Clostridiales bacterium]|jgi:ADP-glucose pyrophosphorylase|nr:hypothetical protein [Clostridiales bacterium]HBR09270.1 hypothetical protein [Clostridiales bacterium]